MKPQGIVQYVLPILVIFSWIIDISYGAVSEAPLGDFIASLIAEAVSFLPIPKLLRYQIKI